METVFDKPLDTELSRKQNSSDSNLATTAKTVVGAINENTSAITSNSTAIANVQNGLAYIVGNTNTTGSTLAVGQFVYVKGHSTIAEGLRKVSASISANGNITTSNTSPVSEGGLNALNNRTAPYAHATPGVGRSLVINREDPYKPILAYGIISGTRFVLFCSSTAYNIIYAADNQVVTRDVTVNGSAITFSTTTSGSDICVIGAFLSYSVN